MLGAYYTGQSYAGQSGIANPIILVIDDVLHDHYIDNIVINLSDIIDIYSSIHTHTAENVVITQRHVLTVQDAVHSQTTQEVVLFGTILIVHDVYHQMIVEQAAVLINARNNRPRVIVVRQKPRTAVSDNNSRFTVEISAAGPRIAQERNSEPLVIANDQKPRVDKFR